MESEECGMDDLLDYITDSYMEAIKDAEKTIFKKEQNNDITPRYLLELIENLNDECDYLKEKNKKLENMIYHPEDYDDSSEYPFDF